MTTRTKTTLQELIDAGPQWLKEEIAYWTDFEPGEDEDGYTLEDAWELVCDAVCGLAAETPGCIGGRVPDGNAAMFTPDAEAITLAKSRRRVLKKIAKAAGLEL